MQKRWGKEFRDSRDWPEYNERLGVRGEFYLDFEFAGKWNGELAGLNEGKRGGRVQHSVFDHLGCLTCITQ